MSLPYKAFTISILIALAFAAPANSFAKENDKPLEFNSDFIEEKSGSDSEKTKVDINDADASAAHIALLPPFDRLSIPRWINQCQFATGQNSHLNIRAPPHAILAS